MSSHPLPPPPARGDVLCQPLCSHSEWVGREHGEGGTEVETRTQAKTGPFTGKGRAAQGNGRRKRRAPLGGRESGRWGWGGQALKEKGRGNFGSGAVS